MKKSGIVFWLAVGIVILFWSGTWYLIPKLYKESTGLGAGTFGDMFGGVNALFSGLAFVGLIYTILLQRRELARQEEASKDQAEDLKRQKELLQFQFVLAHVKELIAIKNKKIGNLNVVIKSNEYGVNDVRCSGMAVITELVRKNYSSDTTYNPPLKQWMDSFFYILQYTIDSELEVKYKNLIIDFIFHEVSWSEVQVLYGMNKDNGHNLMLLNQFGLQNKTK
ncbi:hypothetical protein [Paenibacillus xylanexedens]|uniref:hypothetical protein n=1 Tax=Paenibacillus xylanexedens TaxID=528191 RepID=UPI00119CA9D4|nr:hypothetical protein [Paenibacillus xylanexedens]